MKILLRHEHPGTKQLHGKRGHKILKKIARLEKRLGKYHLEESGEESCSSAGSAMRHNRVRHGRRDASLGVRSSSSSSSSSCCCSESDSDSCSDSGTSTPSSSDSSRSPSPGPRHHRHHRHHHRRHGLPRHLPRSKSFAGRGCGSPPPFAPEHHHRHHHHHPHQPPHHSPHHPPHPPPHHPPHHPPHPPPHHPPHHPPLHPPHHPPHHLSHHHPHHEDHYFEQWRRHWHGVCGLRYRPLAQSEPDLPEAELLNGGENRGEDAVREPEGDTNLQEGDQEGNDETTLEGPELSQDLSEKLKETLKKGLLADAKKSLLQKYPASKNCPQLRGPKLNQEFLPVASDTAVKRDAVLLYEQNQIGAGLTALGQAINDLDAKAEAEHNVEMIPILDAMGDAAAIIADAHHNITQMRQAFLAAELNKRVRPVVDTCKADELLFGKDFRDKVKDVRVFAKGKKSREKKEKRKHMDQEGERRKSKRLHHHGIMH